VLKWRFFGPNGTDAGWSEPFADRERAEAWLGETWLDLVERGVEHVELTDGATGEVLFRMSLAEG
jgi:hypothetical protein